MCEINPRRNERRASRHGKTLFAENEQKSHTKTSSSAVACDNYVLWISESGVSLHPNDGAKKCQLTELSGGKDTLPKCPGLHTGKGIEVQVDISEQTLSPST